MSPIHLDRHTLQTLRRRPVTDSIRLDASKIEDIAGGAIRVPANFGRAGMVLVYGDSDPGGARREYVSAEALFDEGALASLRDITISVLHPQEREVTTDNWTEEAVGHVASELTREGDYLTGFVILNDAWTIERVRDKSHPEHLSELSPGYDAESVSEAGTSPDGEAYDHRQLARTYNHMALLPPNTGRSGRDIALRLDSKGNPMPPDEENKPPFTDAQLKALGDMIASALAAKADALPPEELDPAEKEPAPKKTDAAPYLDARSEERRINDAVDLREKARAVLGAEYSFRGKSARDTMIEVVQHVDSKFDARGLSDDRIRGEFEGACRLDAKLRAAGDGTLPYGDDHNDAPTDDEHPGMHPVARRMLANSKAKP